MISAIPASNLNPNFGKAIVYAPARPGLVSSIITPCLSIAAIPAANLNPNFGHATVYAPPRRGLVSAIITY